MLVKHIANNSGHTALEKMGVYKVISIDFILISEIPSSFKVSYRVLNTNGIAALYDQSLFEIIDPVHDADFVFMPYANGSFGLIPMAMSYPGFWEAFFDGNDIAINVFKNRFPEYKDKLF